MTRILTVKLKREQLDLLHYDAAMIHNAPRLASVFLAAMRIYDAFPGCEMELTIEIKTVAKLSPKDKARAFLEHLSDHDQEEYTR